MNLVSVRGWEQHPWLMAGFTTRQGGTTSAYGAAGELNLGLTKEDDAGIVRTNRAALVEAAGANALATVSQAHGVEIHRVAEGGPAGKGDGLVTSAPGLLLGVMAADCVPVLVADTRLRVVGAFHAGWRGTAAGIVSAGVARMMTEFGARPEDMVAAVGPSIGPCCYTVGEELRPAFPTDLFKGDRLDLWEANRRQLAEAGVTGVAVIGECTKCTVLRGRGKYFSHRGDAGVTGRGMGVVGIRP